MYIYIYIQTCRHINNNPQKNKNSLVFGLGSLNNRVQGPCGVVIEALGCSGPGMQKPFQTQLPRKDHFGSRSDGP